MDERPDHPGPADSVARRPAGPARRGPAWLAPAAGVIVRAPTGKATLPRWRRLVRSARGAAGLAILAAALLLWPFAGWSAIPWLIGLALLVVLRLLRLDGPLRGWVLHVGGVAVVIGLMARTTPWEWALATSIGVLLAGLVLLPRWRVAAAGAVLCLVAGVGFGISSYRSAMEQEAIDAHKGDTLRATLGEGRPSRVLPALLQAITRDDPEPMCRLLQARAQAAVLAATGAPDCMTAVGILHLKVAGVVVNEGTLPQPVVGADGWRVDACATLWRTAVGAALGTISIVQTDASVKRFVVVDLRPCP